LIYKIIYTQNIQVKGGGRVVKEEVDAKEENDGRRTHQTQMFNISNTHEITQVDVSDTNGIERPTPILSPLAKHNISWCPVLRSLYAGKLFTISSLFCSVTQGSGWVSICHARAKCQKYTLIISPVDPPRGMLSTVPQAAGRPNEVMPATPKGERAASTPVVLVEAAMRTAAAAAMVVAAGSTSFLQLLFLVIVNMFCGCAAKATMCANISK
jgi:hypothetical protein